jgi:hypothetical protein
MHCHDEEGSDQTHSNLFRSAKGDCHTDDCVSAEISGASGISNTNWPTAPVQVADTQTLDPNASAKLTLSRRNRLMSSAIQPSHILAVSGTLRI